MVQIFKDTALFPTLYHLFGLTTDLGGKAALIPKIARSLFILDSFHCHLFYVQNIQA